MSQLADKNVKEEVKAIWDASHDKTYSLYINDSNHFSKFHGLPNVILQELSGSETKILLYLMHPTRIREKDSACWKRNHNQYIIQKDIAEGTKLDKSQVSRGLQSLEAKNCLWIVKENGMRIIQLNKDYFSIGRSDKDLNFIAQMARIHAPKMSD